MATRWEGENLLVKLSGILRFCCESVVVPSSSTAPSYNSVLPQGYHRGEAVDEPQVITDPDPWGQRLANHRLEGARYTIIPTISVVPPWDDDTAQNETSNLPDDLTFGESFRQIHYINPTPVLGHHSDLPSAGDRGGNAILNATQRFYDALRVVLHGGGVSPPEVPSFRDDAGAGINVDVAGLAPHVLDSFDPQVSSTRDPEALVMSPLLQVCAALGILVVLMVILFHSHHFRRDCVTERRALRRVARRYHVARAQDDVERNDEVTDVTL